MPKQDGKTMLKQAKNKLPNNVGRGEYKDEYAILITLLNRVSGHSHANVFQPWMYYIIGRIISGQEHYDWAFFISDVLHKQITGFLFAHEFHVFLPRVLNRLSGSVPRVKHRWHSQCSKSLSLCCTQNQNFCFTKAFCLIES